jgi:hypothetical protein
MANKQFEFTINLGNKNFDADKNMLIRLYGIEEKKSVLLKRLSIDSASFVICSSCLPEECFNFFYVVVNIKTCQCECSTGLNLLGIFKHNDKKILVNEQTTIANIFCFSRLFKYDHHHIILCGKDKFLNIAYDMRNNFIVANGVLSSVIQSNPNGLETNSYPLFNYLSNIIYYCTVDEQIFEQFLFLSEGNSILDGMLNLARYPFKNVKDIYDLIANKNAIYNPALNTITLPHWKGTTVPDQWTLTIKINNSGSKNFLMGGPAYMVFDKNNRGWLTNNTRQGTPNSSTFCTIVKPDGSPESFSPLFGGGLLGAGFGIAINSKKNEIAIGNFGWGPREYNPQEGSVSIIKSNGEFLSPPNGFTNGFKRAQGVYYDRNDNLWICSWGTQKPLGANDDPIFNFTDANSAVIVYIKGNPNNYDVYRFNNPFFGTFDIVGDDQDNMYVSNAGNLQENVRSSVYHFRLINNKITRINSWISNHANTNGVETFRQINISPSGYIFVAAVLTSRILKFDRQLNHIENYTTNMDSPWGVEFDDFGTMYVSNFRQDTVRADIETFDMEGKFGVTVVYNEDDNTNQIVTLPTGGDQVMLANGFPLYGSNSKPSYEPLMRLTGAKVDCIGNLWAVNNWKPALINDFESNPGGDGVVIFIGLAETNT